MADTGSQCSVTANTTMRMTPLTNSGMTVMDSEEMVIAAIDAGCRAAARRYTPTRIEVGTMITSAKPASSSELPSACHTIEETGVLYWSDVPQWPVTKWPAHST